MKLQEIRNQKNLTQQQLAQLAGLSINIIAQIEAGTRGKNPSWETVARLAKALGVSPEELFPVDTDSAA